MAASHRVRAALFAVAVIVALSALCGTRTFAVEEHRTFKDWLAACRPDGYCSAITGVNPAAGGADADYILRIGRQPGADRLWQISFTTVAVTADRDRPMNARIDGAPAITLHPVAGYEPLGAVNDFFVTEPALGNRILGAISAGNRIRFEFLDISGAPHDADFSLSGLSASLLWIDERQDRLDSPRRTERPDDLEPAPRLDKPAAIAAGSLPPALLDRHGRESDCEALESEFMANFEPVIGPLSDTAMLYALPCTAGAYQVGYRLYVVESGEIGGIETLYFADYSASHGWTGTDLLFSVDYDPATKTLASFYKGRGIGDCGSTGRWRWVDYAFALEEFRATDACEGRLSDDWPLIYQNPQ
ncbi:MAG: DUF1176 domain-containing protein [Hyphomicrobiales bacterium]|nr:DUF1176 domain-containing protein [Hyphomicrobiales bacterium]